MKLTIERMRYSDSAGFKEWEDPSWDQIKDYLIANLLGSSGFVEIELSGDTEVSIRGDSNLYLVLVDCLGQFRKLLFSSAEFSNPNELVPMDDGESLRKDVIDDLDEGLKMVKAYLDSGEFVDLEPYQWRDA
jgi:hypothetical protein